jgi:DNA-directed RNA polymerase subunit RPC12/RpoP
MQHSCPKCSSGNVDRVRVAHIREQRNTVLGWRVYHCRDCGERFDDVSLGHICPECFSGDVTRVPRESFKDHVKHILGWRIYRCRECAARFYDRPLPKAS